ncbi:MAG: HPr(Ser) kinase/phosphatase [Erysipelotrichaceae bacterium]
MEEKKVYIKELADFLNLKQLTGNDEALNRWVIVSDVNRPGLELSGFLLESELKRVIILGNKELSYIYTLDPETRLERFKSLTDGFTPCIIISSNRHCPSQLVQIASERNFPVFVTMKKSSRLLVEVVGFLEKKLAPSDNIHGGLMSIYGKGVMILGPSGIGKSEVALELIKKGHVLVADDRVDVKRIQNRITGQAPDILYGMLEIRGIGIIDCVKMFGASSVTPDVNVDFVVKLSRWNDDSAMRLTDDQQLTYRILDMDVPMIDLPVSEGRSISTIIESAVTNFNLKLMGFDSQEEFYTRQMDFIRKKEGDE